MAAQIEDAGTRPCDTIISARHTQSGVHMVINNYFIEPECFKPPVTSVCLLNHTTFTSPYEGMHLMLFRG